MATALDPLEGQIALFAPGDRPDLCRKAAASGADAVVIDLEDAVLPDRKVFARSLIAEAGIDMQNVILRVNSVDTGWHADDLSMAAALKVAAVMVPKACDSDLLSTAFDRSGAIRMIALIETAAGVANARQIASARGVARLAFGSVDFCLDLGLAHSRETLYAARFEIVLASRLASLPAPFDGVTTSTTDVEEVRSDAAYASALGFGGKLAIHPRQLAPIREGFRPSAADLEWAQKIIDAPALGAVAVDGAMVDAPVRLRAANILLRATAASATS